MRNAGAIVTFILLSFSSYGVEMWSEDFESDALGDGCTASCVAPSSGKWSTYASGAHDMDDSFDYAKVTSFSSSQVMEIRDPGGEVVWDSEAITITSYTDVSIDLDWYNYNSSADYLKFYYVIDGVETIFGDFNGSSITDGTWSTASISGLSGNSLIIRAKALNSSDSERWRFDNIVVTGTAPACTPPTTQASNVVFTAVTETTMDISWTNGNGDATLVVLQESGVSITDPTNTYVYSANAAYSTGDDLGTGNYAIYNGASSTVSVTGLSSGVTYDVAIYSYNTADECYHLDELTGSQMTTCTPPVTQASSMVFSSVGKTSMDISWTNGSGSDVLVVARISGETLTDPYTGTGYTANSSFGDGEEIGTANYVIYNGTGTSLTMTGLLPATNYVVAIYSYESASNCYNLIELLSSQVTLSGTNYSIASGTYEIDAYDGDTITTCGGTFTDSNPSSTGNYGDNEDYRITFCSGSGDPLSFDFNNDGFFDALGAGDTLFMYDEEGELIMKIDASDDPSFSQFELSTTSTCVSFRFISDGATNDDGWGALVECIALPTTSNGNAPAADIALQAPYICNFKGYSGSTSTYYHEDLPNNMVGTGGSCPSSQAFLGTIENNSWLKFVAGATSISMDFTVTGCIDGIQVAILKDDGDGWTRYSDCNLSDSESLGTFTLTATGLTVDNEYYLMADGNAGSNCDYTIDVDASSGIVTVDAGDDLSIESGTAAAISADGPTGATYTWNSLDGEVVNVVGANQTFYPTVETTYVVEVSGSNFCENEKDTVVVRMAAVLPVDFLGLSAVCYENHALVEWQTSSELNNELFILEKSLDGFEFNPIAYVDGAGTSTEYHHYSFQDEELEEGVVYYRLQQVDFDGQYSYSGIVSLNGCDEVIYEIERAFINPSSNQIIIDYFVGKTEKVSVYMYDVQGKVIFQKNMTLYQQEGETAIELSKTISNGLYFLNIKSDHSLYVEKLMNHK